MKTLIIFVVAVLLVGCGRTSAPPSRESVFDRELAELWIKYVFEPNEHTLVAIEQLIAVQKTERGESAREAVLQRLRINGSRSILAQARGAIVTANEFADKAVDDWIALHPDYRATMDQATIEERREIVRQYVSQLNVNTRIMAEDETKASR